MGIIYKLKKFLKRQRFLLQKKPGLLVTKKELCDVMFGHAYIADEEIKLFSQIAQKTKGPIVEIGCAYGASSTVFLLNSQKYVKLFSIDPFVVDSMSTFRADQKTCKNNVSWILKAFKKSYKLSDWKIIPDFSYNVKTTWKEGIEVLFIDGDHTYEAVKKDFDDWLPYVNRKGIILIHDSRKEVGSPVSTFNRGWPGPTRLAEELKKSDKVKLIGEAFSVTAWEKV